MKKMFPSDLARPGGQSAQSSGLNLSPNFYCGFALSGLRFAPSRLRRCGGFATLIDAEATPPLRGGE